MSDLALLHALRCGGYSGIARIAAATGLSEADIESGLIDLAVAGFVVREFGAWGLTEAGRQSDAVRINDELRAAGTHAVVRDAYLRFMVLNPELLDLCTAWQLRSVDGAMVVNDHSDPAYDARVLGRFAALHDRAVPVLADLAAALPRFGRYRVRLTGALDLARGGRRDYLTDTIGAYHTVWAELHEDLLATLGIPR
jgi:hypothetical protein